MRIDDSSLDKSITNNIIPFPRSNTNAPFEKQNQDAATGPIESKMRQAIARLKKSTYPDSFDWSVYDRIASTFETPPRDGTVYRSGIKLVNWHTSCSKCHYSLEIDSYGRGCFHDCTYCYAKEQLTAHGYWNRPSPFPIDLTQVREIFYTVFETDRPSKWRSIFEKRIPFRIGSMSDSFMWMDTKYGVTKELLRIFNFYRYPYVIFTRSDLVAHDDYIELIKPEISSVQFSISGNNNSLMRRLEPGAPSYRRRLAAITKLTNIGIWTTVRINPLFPTHPDGFFSNRDETVARFGGESRVPSIAFYDDSFVDQLADAGAPSILVGFVRLSQNAVKSVGVATGTDFRQFFRDDISKANRDRHYSSNEISKYYAAFSKHCNRRGVRFSTCYIGNGLQDYFQYQSSWSNRADCCDILGNVKGIKSSCQEISWNERMAFSSNRTLATRARAIEERFQASSNDKSPSSHEAATPSLAAKNCSTSSL